MIDFDTVDFNECRSKEVISFLERSVSITDFDEQKIETL